MYKKRIITYLTCFFLIITNIVLPVGCTVEKKSEDGVEVSNQEDNLDTNTHSEKDKVSQKEESDENNIDEDENNQKDKVSFISERPRKTIEVPYEPISFETTVPSYSINKDLSDVVNLDQFGNFTEEQKSLISQNGFVVIPTKEEQLFYIYENNEYLKVPSFISTDSVLQVYHIFFDYSLRTLELEKLLGKVEKLTESMLDKSVYLYNEVNNEEIKEALLKNIAFFSTAWISLDKELPEGLPERAVEMANNEYDLIREQSGFKQSNIFPYELDYSQYKPRGHYTRNDDFKRYFKAMMWYGQAPFPLYKISNDNNKVRNIEQTLQALLITYSVFLDKDGSNDIELWENIYDPTNFYVGSSDDLTIYDYKDLLIKVYGDNPDINTLNYEKKLDELYLETDKLPEPKIKAKYTAVTTPVGKQLRFMGQRYVPDAEIVQELVEPIIRPIPSGLDVMGVIGSERALDIQTNINNVDEQWPGYMSNFNKMKEKMDALSEDKWKSNMYYGWMWTLKGLLKEFEDGYPSFMTNEAWEDKSLSTALASWAELKHDTILYGKQSGAECGGGEEPPKIRGYVEPNVEVYEKLLWLTQYSRKNLKEREILTGGLESKLQRFEDLLQFLLNCSVKELRNEELTEDEYYQLLTYGGLLEYLTSSFAGDGMRWFEITSETDKNMAIIADIHTIAPNEFSLGGYFEVGVGPAYEIYVVVPIDGKLYLTRGGVFSYYEFDSDKRLTDEEWQRILKEDKQPSQLKWMDKFINGEEKEIPMPTEPYSSGC
ncbi:DUF3160 domain-containing protein [Sporosalibacterium faouarense]|uniref:DUF3160 domain-containing protein n=1 Tax=Sporosalibacterium faouarense TaxID=516123 RepID=UPI00192B646A